MGKAFIVSMVSPDSSVSMFSYFTKWLNATPLGTYLIEREQRWFDTIVADIFGYKAIQIQLSQIDFLRENRIPSHVYLAEETGGSLQACAHALPFANQSVDLLLLPHVLDFTLYPQEVLREAHRVLMPEGRLLITGFNPCSLWIWRRIFKRDLWRSNQITLPRLKDWLILLGFESMQGEYFGYTLPLQHPQWLEMTEWMDAVGNRWWPLLGSVYCLDMIKRVHGMHMLTPQWNMAPIKNAVPLRDVSCKVNRYE